MTVEHDLKLTMVDGKVCNTLTGTSSTLRCFLCKATSSQFNDIQSMQSMQSRVVDLKGLHFGMSVLHARLRFLDFVLGLAYKISLREEQEIREREGNAGRRTKQEKAADKKADFLKVKAAIQSAIREQMGLLVDIPKAGFGNTNDGNTSRRFFNDSEKVSRITKIDLELLRKFRLILEIISSGREIDVAKFATL